MPGHTPGLALPYDPEQACRLLAEAGYLEGRGMPPLRIWYMTPEMGAATADLLREALPVEVELHQVAPLHLRDDVAGCHLLFDGWTADLPDPDNFLRHSQVLGILRKAGWHDPELYALLDRAAHTPDRACRMAMYRQADRRLVTEQALLVPLIYGRLRALLQPRVSGARPSKMSFFRLKDVVVEKHALAE